MFPFKALCEHFRHAVGEASPEPGISPRAVLDALVENMPSDRAQPDLLGDADDEPSEYHAGS